MRKLIEYISLKRDQKVGIICANGQVLKDAPALKNCGVDDLSSVVIAGAENLPEMQNLSLGTRHLNPAKFGRELAELANKTVKSNPSIAAFVIECANLPPYAVDIQEAVRLPVFDATTLINWVYSAVVRRPFSGYI